MHAWVDDAPLLEAWRRFVGADAAPFTIPGHKRRAGSLDAAFGRLLDADVPLFGGLDSVRLDSGVLRDAEQRAARLWGAEWCRFSTGGSTHANQVVALALGKPDDTVLVSRTAHRSTLSGLVLAGLRPVWLQSEIDERFGLPSGLSVTALESALEAHPDAVGVLLVEPSYLGTLSDLPSLVAAAHARGKLVAVDQAWGAHLGFARDYPGHALAAAADVLVTSAHKTLPAFTQGALVLARTDRLDRDRLERAFETSNTTSPAGAILASIDASRALLAHPDGARLLEVLAARIASLRSRLREVGVLVPGPEDFRGRFDPAKLVLCLAPSGRSGLALEAMLADAGLPVEMADRDTIVPLVTLLDDEQSLERLADALLAALHDQPRCAPRPVRAGAAWGGPSPQACSPREAFFAEHELVTYARAPGRISAELVAPYPPGVPVLVPGEVITREAIERLRSAAAAGLRIAYATDPTLATIHVLRTGVAGR